MLDDPFGSLKAPCAVSYFSTPLSLAKGILQSFVAHIISHKHPDSFPLQSHNSFLMPLLNNLRHMARARSILLRKFRGYKATQGIARHRFARKSRGLATFAYDKPFE